MFCALLGHTGERLQDHWSSGFKSGSFFTSEKIKKVKNIFFIFF